MSRDARMDSAGENLIQLASRPSRISLRRQWILSFLGTTLLVVGGVTSGAWWFANRQTRAAVESRLTSIARSVASPNYPMTPTVLRAVAELTDTELILLDASGALVDTTFELSPEARTTPIVVAHASTGINIDHAYSAPNKQIYHAGWARFEGAESPGRSQPIAWVGILMDQATVRQMRWQALALPLITGFATAIGLGAIAGWLTDRVVRRLQTVQRKVQRIAAGDYAPIELSGQRDELFELTSNINRMAGELQQMESRIHAAERERLVHALAAGLSHDLRNTLTGARLAIQLHDRQCSSDNESIAVAMRQLRLAEDQLMRWLRLGGEVESNESQTLQVVLDKAIALVQPMTEHLGSQLTTARCEELEPLDFSRGELLTSAVLNLLLNAIQAGGQAGSIELQTKMDSSSPPWLAIEISDNGPGPTPEVQSRMFDLLVTTKREGVGLGLALVAKAAKELGGEVTWHRTTEAAQQAGDRTVFCLRLPITNSQNKEPN